MSSAVQLFRFLKSRPMIAGDDADFFGPIQDDTLYVRATFPAVAAMRFLEVERNHGVYHYLQGDARLAHGFLKVISRKLADEETGDLRAWP